MIMMALAIRQRAGDVSRPIRNIRRMSGVMVAALAVLLGSLAAFGHLLAQPTDYGGPGCDTIIASLRFLGVIPVQSAT